MKVSKFIVSNVVMMICLLAILSQNKTQAVVIVLACVVAIVVPITYALFNDKKDGEK